MAVRAGILQPQFFLGSGGLSVIFWEIDMKVSKVFRKAAELVATKEEEYSCDAVLKAANGEAPGALLFWRSRFTPREDSPEHYWLRDQTDMTKKQKHEWRILALCLASEVAKGEDL